MSFESSISNEYDNARREAGHDGRVVIPGREANPESGDCCARFRVRARARPGM